MTTFLLISFVPICGPVYVNSNDESGFDFDTNKKMPFLLNHKNQIS
jgi:hypothetical protein